jgi:hypothetical protein
MLDKCYDHPLYSLDLLPRGTRPHDPRYVVEVPQGILVVSPELVQRGRKVSTAVCDRAVVQVCAYQLVHPRLAESGFTAGWRDSLLYWREQIYTWIGERYVGDVHERLTRADFDGALARATALYEELRHAARLAGIPEAVVPQKQPRAILAILDVLQQAASAVARPAVTSRLAWFGFDRARADDLTALVPHLTGLRHRLRGIHEERGRASDRIAVIRGALCGDIGLFSGLAVRLLGPRGAPLLMKRLFPRGPVPAAR